MARHVFSAGTGNVVFCTGRHLGASYGEQLVGTITAIDTFLGVILGISKAKYNKCSK